MSGRSRKNTPHDGLLWRRWLLLGAFGLAGAVVLGRAFQLQGLEHERWAAAANDQQRERVLLPARRGAIFDRDGIPLALSHETYRVSVAPREVRDRAAVAGALRGALNLSESAANRATDPDRKWVVVPGRFSVDQRQRMGDMRGVYFERRLERFYPHGEVGRELIGLVSGDGRALGGIEQQFEEALRGDPGYAILRRDAQGDAAPALSLPVTPPRDGADIHLTIDLDLQEIADVALRRAIDGTGASGGDLLIMDPSSGDLLAIASRRDGRGRSLAAITEPYEPGSTLKPLIAAALMAEGLVAPSDSVYGEEGVWNDPNGRTITDSHAEGWMSLRTVIVESSNIGMVKFATRLDEGEQYEYLRDFGFGAPTGVEYPSEATGRLRRPSEWSDLSPASLAMGYEISVTPLQLTAAYAALANGGSLMEPQLVRRIEAGGRILEAEGPVEIRRVISRQVAARVTEVLAQVVNDGTATNASLGALAVAGKTGTARRTGSNGRYEPGAYTSTFVGYFPADDPQLVVLVKLDRPKGAYYGGLIAAPVTRETLQAILAARTSAVDGTTLLTAGTMASSLLPIPRPAAASPVTERTFAPVTLALGGRRGTELPDISRYVEVPALEGLPIRAAVARAHELGFRVRLEGGRTVERSDPAAGASLRRGDTLLLIGRRN
jgi:cell division protein FtsI/penicillin-binding protein 2